jgi:hypothetical protein
MILLNIVIFIKIPVHTFYFIRKFQVVSGLGQFIVFRSDRVPQCT